MHLSKAIREFSTRRLNKLSMPTVKSLDNACKKFAATQVLREQDTARIARIIVALGTPESSQLSSRDIRFVAAAIGSHPEINEQLVSTVLREVHLRKDPRLTRAIFRALLASYSISPQRAMLQEFLLPRLSDLSVDIQQFCRSSGVLNGDGNIEGLADELARTGNVTYSCISRGITSSILSTSYGHALKLASVGSALATGRSDTIKRMFDWALAGVRGVPTSDFYEVCLAPFQRVTPPADVQKLVLSVLVKQFGDPRISEWPRLNGRDGARRREDCLMTIKRWLSIEYLDLFIKIIEKTAVDHQFAPRKKFWLRYFEKGIISDLTLILASDANSVARRTQGQSVESEYMKWASLKSQPDHSVLLMRLGDLVIAEWSHDGALRFWKAGSKSAPLFHKNEYSARELRGDSLKVRTHGGYRDSIVHSHNGQWMALASDAIEFHTGVRI